MCFVFKDGYFIMKKLYPGRPWPGWKEMPFRQQTQAKTKQKNTFTSVNL